MRYFSLAILLCLLFVSSVALAIPVEAVKIQKAYEGLKDIKGSFIQKSFIKDLKKTSVYKGEFLIKLPSKMRWKYDGQEVVISGSEILICQKQEKQAFRGRFDKDVYGQTPIALLGGFADIDREFDITQKGSRLILKPKRPMGGVARIEITPTGGAFPIASFKVIDSYSNTVEITLEDVEVNTGIADSAFELRVPEGLKVYEYNP